MPQDVKVTLLKNYRKQETARRYSLDELATMIGQCEVMDDVRRLREIFHLIRVTYNDDGTVESNVPLSADLPRICFSAEFENKKKDRVMNAYNGLVVLEVNHLANYDEAIAVRDAAGRLPQTMMAFLGASGRSVKIVCRGELFPDKRDPKTMNPLPTSEDEVERFHYRLYNMARRALNAQLDVTIDKLEPRLDRVVYMSADPDVIWHPAALPFYTDGDDRQADGATPAARPQSLEDYMLESSLMPGRSERRTYRLNYLFIVDSVLGKYFELPDEDRVALLLMQIATRCLDEGIPMGLALGMTMQHPVLNGDELLVRKTFDTIYAVENQKEYRKLHKTRPLRSVPDDTLLMMKTDIFLNANYDMRKNVMTGVAQYRDKAAYSFEFQDLDDEARNEMTIRAKELGLKSWDKDIARFIDSPRIEKYDPVNDWLDRLPRWDGTDRVDALAARVPCDTELWAKYFHIWMLGMVAHWKGLTSLTGNALVPLLIGRQGCGKTSFCRILLPRELREYYNDRINFKNETDLNLGLTSFGLINLDEFDRVTQRQQIVLKYLVSTADLKYRPPYGKAYQQQCRFASFIGTTNEMMPLTDPTGARRFVCVNVTGDIDFRSPVEYRQLYAQLCQEIRNGERYWPTREQELELISRNMSFQQESGLGEMVLSVVQIPDNDNEGQWMNVRDISALLKSRFNGYKEEPASIKKIGSFMNRPTYRFKSKHTNTGTAYWVKLRDIDHISHFYSQK